MPRSALIALGALLALGACSRATESGGEKLDVTLRAAAPSAATVRVIVETDDLDRVARLVATLGGHARRRLPAARALVADLPASTLERVAASRAVRRVSLDRRIEGTLERTAATIGARWVTENLGFDGTGVGVAIIDSGVTRSHDDLSPGRVVSFVDFVDFQSAPHDGYGHGTHVAGIIAGNGQDSAGARRGIAPGAHLIALRALDEEGDGYISNAIAALDYAVEHRAEYNIRVINLSVAAGVYESYKTDPLTLAAGRAVDAGIVVVTAAGNLGRNARGRMQYGGITAPGNAPWVLTVGAASHNRTIDRSDDTVAPFSSLGPSYIDSVSKPDLVAPGVGIESLADPGSTLFRARPGARIWGTVATARPPYLTLSGTSMASPVVAATVALMVQANPALTPGAVKAILKQSAESHIDESQLAQGAGFLNARAAVELARTFAEIPAAAELLDDLVDVSEWADAAPATPCDIARGDADCGVATMMEECAAPGCFARLAGAIVGAQVRPEDTIVWTTRSRPVTPRKRVPVNNEEANRMPGVAE